MKTYTFHVSLPGFGRVWRKLELPSDRTLADLHLAIQEAFDFGQDHLYSFFMSGRAWDADTEYCLPEGSDPWGGAMDAEWVEVDENGEPLESDEGAEAEDELQEIEAPTPDDIRQMVEEIKANPALRERLIAEAGVPAFMLDVMLNNSDQIIEMLESGAMEDLLGLADGAPGNVLTTTLDSLDLRAGKTFLYLFDYGDSWEFKVRVHAINPDADASAAYPRLVESVGDAPEQYGNWSDEEDADDEDEGEE